MQKQGWLVADEWLAGMMGCPAYRLETGVDALFQSRCAAAELGKFLQEKGCFAYAKVGTREHEKISFLEEMGFRLIDTNMTMEKRCEHLGIPVSAEGARFASPADREAVRVIAETSFLYSRFHMDPLVPKAKADLIKVAWSENYFRGRRGDYMVVGPEGPTPAGFLLLLRAGDHLVIDLIAVTQDSRLRGVAASMIGFAEREIKGVDRIVVGTQVANVPSIRLYEKLGFRVYSSSYVFHFHHRG